MEKVFSASHPDPTEIEKAKKVLIVRTSPSLDIKYHEPDLFVRERLIMYLKIQEHEQALIDAIARLEDASDGESGNN